MTVSAGLAGISLGAGCSSNNDSGDANNPQLCGGVPCAGGFVGASGGAPSAGGMITSAMGGTQAAGGAQAAGGVLGMGGAMTAGTSGGGVAGSGAGGMPAAGGMVNVGGSMMASDIKITGSSMLCMGAMPMVPMTQIAACSADKCTGAHCVPMDQIPMGTDVTQLAKCPDGSYCTPDDYIATQGKFLVKKCTSLENAEGRCISTCVPQVAKQMDQLPKDVCMDSERCAPCWNPIDGSDTKACTQGCDTGNPMTKVTFAKCGMDRGVCVPKTIVPMDLQGIPMDSCAADHLCAPTEKAKDLNYQFPKCTPSGLAGLLGMANMAGQKGGCVPAYIVGTMSSALMADDCTGAGDLCAPCTNPLSTPTANAPTGACPWP